MYRDLLKLLKYFNDTAISTSFVLPAASVRLVRLVSDLNGPDSAIAALFKDSSCL